MDLIVIVKPDVPWKWLHGAAATICEINLDTFFQTPIEILHYLAAISVIISNITLHTKLSSQFRDSPYSSPVIYASLLFRFHVYICNTSYLFFISSLTVIICCLWYLARGCYPNRAPFHKYWMDLWHWGCLYRQLNNRLVLHRWI